MKIAMAVAVICGLIAPSIGYSAEKLPQPMATGLKNPAGAAVGAPFKVTENEQRIRIESSALEASIRKERYVSGVEAQSFLDKKTGFLDLGYGLDIVDWLMEPGSDEAYRGQLVDDLRYLFNNSYHGKRAKRSIEGPQICTKAGKLSPKVIEGKDFVAVKQDYTYHLAAPGKKTGSRWEQTLEGWLRTLANDPDESVPDEADVPTPDHAARILERADRILEVLLPTLSPELLAAPRKITRRGRTGVVPPWVVLRHVVNHTTYHRGQVASKLKRFGIQQPETDLVYWAREQLPQPG